MCRYLLCCGEAASEENIKAITEEAPLALETESEEAASEAVIIKPAVVK